MTNTISIIASLWIREGALAAFEAYECKAARIMKKYGGLIEYTVRPSVLEEASDQPFEIHLVRFPSLEMFEKYRVDTELKALSPERDEAIIKTHILIGMEGPKYST